MKQQFKTANIFSDVKVEQFPRHLFDLSYTNSFTCNHGLAIPVFIDDVRPGDKIDLNSFGRIQLQPLATATLQNLKVYFRYFYVPYRLLWDKWDKFISQDGFVETPLIAPYTLMNSTHLNTLNKEQHLGNLLDMLGVNLVNLSGSLTDDGKAGILDYDAKARLQFNIFRFLAYLKIWDRYFRDENLQDTVCPESDEVVSGYNAPESLIFNLLPVAYEKDYFTTALPWTQKGEPVNLSSYITSSDVIPVNTYEFTDDDGITMSMPQFKDITLGLVYPKQGAAVREFGGISKTAETDVSVNVPESLSPYLGSIPRAMDLKIGVYPEDLEKINVSSININELRYANALQRYLERLALGGNRPAEFYLSMYGVKVDDLRIGDPLYLGGGSTYVNVTPVTQQARSTDEPMGSLAGNGTSTPSFRINEPYYCQEFGIVMGIMYIRPELNYMQGLCKEMQLFSHLDFYNPIFAHLGEEAVMKSELILKSTIDNTTNDTNNDEIFGYQSRYAYLKHRRNEIHGELKTNLSHWLLASHLPQDIALNSDFITVQQNYDIFANINEDEHHYICEIHHKYLKEANMPDFSVPSL